MFARLSTSSPKHIYRKYCILGKGLCETSVMQYRASVDSTQFSDVPGTQVALSAPRVFQSYLTGGGE